MSEPLLVDRELMTRPLGSMVSIDPESLPLGTNPSFEFHYFDISCTANGRLQMPDTSITYAEAPSRARRIVKNGDVLMSTVRPNLKAFAYCNLSEGSYVASTGFAVLRAIEGNDPRYTLYSILSDDVARQIDSYVVGSNYPAINSSDVKRLRIPDWKPPHQRRIAEILSTVDEAIEQTEALIAKYQQIKAGLMHDLFTRGVTPDGHLRPTRAQAHHLYKESPLGWIPKEWEVGELRRWLTYLSYGFTNPMPESDEGPYMVTAADINADRIQYDTCRRTTRDAFDRLLTQKSRPKVGDVLLTKDGTLGRIALVDRLDVCINQSVAVLRPADTRHSQFIASMLSAPMWQQKMLSDAGGSTIKHIYITVVSKMLVAWPSRSEELEAISARIESCTAMIECEEDNLEKLRQQKHGLMQDLLTGRVRVKVGEAEEKI
jgi:type I restriction enzyme S subunit